jgi:hypothetical protein
MGSSRPIIDRSRIGARRSGTFVASNTKFEPPVMFTTAAATSHSQVANINAKFVGPMSKSLANEKKAFANNDRKVKAEIGQNETEIARLIEYAPPMLD